MLSRFPLLLTFLAQLVFPLAGQTPSNADSVAAVASELRELWQQRNQALLKRDWVALERVYAEEFLFVRAVARVVANRTETIQEAMSNPAPAEVLLPDFGQIMLFGDVAVLRYPLPERFSTFIFVKRGGRWQFLQTQSTTITQASKQ